MYIPSQHKVSVHITDALIVVSAAKFPLSESHCSAFVLVGVLSGGFCGAARRKNSFKNMSSSPKLARKFRSMCG